MWSVTTPYPLALNVNVIYVAYANCDALVAARFFTLGFVILWHVTALFLLLLPLVLSVRSFRLLLLCFPHAD